MWRFALVVIGGIVVLIVVSWDHIVTAFLDFVGFLAVAVPTTLIVSVVGYVAARLIRGALLERRLHEAIEVYKRELVMADQRAELMRQRRETIEREEEAQREQALRSLFGRRDESPS